MNTTDTLTLTILMTTLTCCWETCGMTFAVPKRWEDARRAEHSTFYCPNGHSLSFPGETESEKLQKQLERERSNAAWYSQRYDQIKAEARDLGNQVRAQNAAKTRLLRRVTNGVCPCCQRSFANVQRHMVTKHPEQVAGATP